MRAARPARLLAALTVAVVVLAAAGCSSSSNSSSTTTTGKTEIGDAATVSSTMAPTTTAPTTTITPVPTGLDTPKAAAERLYSAWKANDRAGALTVAEPIAVDAMFASAPGDYRLYSGCDTGEFAESGCLYRGDAGTIQLTMEKRAALWVVISVFYAAN